MICKGPFLCSTAPQGFPRPDRGLTGRRAQTRSRSAGTPTAQRAPTSPGRTLSGASTVAGSIITGPPAGELERALSLITDRCLRRRVLLKPMQRIGGLRAEDGHLLLDDGDGRRVGSSCGVTSRRGLAQGPSNRGAGRTRMCRDPPSGQGARARGHCLPRARARPRPLQAAGRPSTIRCHICRKTRKRSGRVRRHRPLTNVPAERVRDRASRRRDWARSGPSPSDPASAPAPASRAPM